MFGGVFEKVVGKGCLEGLFEEFSKGVFERMFKRSVWGDVLKGCLKGC